MDTNPSIIGYARVSTEQQAYQQALRQQVERLQFAGAQKVYADVASRTNDERAALREIMNLAQAGQIQQVLVTRLDRVTSSPGLFEELSNIFRHQGVVLVALDEQIDIHSVEGEFVAGLQVQFAKREVNTTRLRIQKAHEHRRKKGKPNHSVPWGYIVVDGQYKLDPTPFLCLLEDRPGDEQIHPGRTKAELGRDIIDLFFKGGSLGQAIQLLHQKYGIYKFKFKAQNSGNQMLVFDEDNTFSYKKSGEVRASLFRWSRCGIRKYLDNPVLQGHTPYFVMKKYTDAEGHIKRLKSRPHEVQVIYNTHPDERLLSDEEVNQIQAILKKNAQLKGFGSTTRRHLLTGLLKCALCGSRMKSQGIHYKGKARRRCLYYQCKMYREAACSAKRMIDETVAEKAITAELILRAQELTTLAGQTPVRSEPIEVKQLRMQLAGLEQLGYNPAFDLAKQELNKQINHLLNQLHSQSLQAQANRELLLSAFCDPTYWRTLLEEEKRQLFAALVEQVVVRDGQVEQIQLKV
jgi:site-specific DNA recombinase